MKNDNLTAIEGMAIVCIILYHICYLQRSLTALNVSLSVLDIVKYAGLFGFTFTAGYKLMQNHASDLSDKSFLKQYARKRAIRLGRPYLGYTLLLLIPFMVMRDGLGFGGLGVPTESYYQIASEFIRGNNIIAPPLWYLYALIAITLIALMGAYLAGPLGPYVMALPFAIVCRDWLPFYVVFCIGMLAAKGGWIDKSVNPPSYLLFLGLNSYGLYLFHYPLFSVVARLLSHAEVPELLVIALTFVVTVIGSICAYRLINRSPARALL